MMPPTNPTMMPPTNPTMMPPTNPTMMPPPNQEFGLDQGLGQGQPNPGEIGASNMDWMQQQAPTTQANNSTNELLPDDSISMASKEWSSIPHSVGDVLPTQGQYQSQGPPTTNGNPSQPLLQPNA